MIFLQQFTGRFLVVTLLLSLGFLGSVAQEASAPKSPMVMVKGGGKIVYTTFYTSCEVAAINIKSGEIDKSIKVDVHPTGLAIKDDRLYVTTSLSEGELIELELPSMRELRRVKVGHGAMTPILNPKRDIIYIANQYDDNISVVDLKTFEEITTIDVLRQPRAMDITPDGKMLCVANFLPNMRADLDTVACEVSIVNLKKSAVSSNLILANGSNALRGLKITPDGKYALIAHNLGRFQVPTSQLEQGWMNTSALSIINLKEETFGGTILLDESDRGAAASWGIDVDDSSIIVTHSGTHDFSVIDYPNFVKKLSAVENIDELSYDFSFLRDIRTRVRVSGNGPRSVMIDGDNIYVENYFSDVIDKFSKKAQVVELTESFALTPNLKNSFIREGEIAFHDATHCFQEWQACTGCHPNDARTDGLNWDLLNDGLGNQKNCKSMLYSHVTPPSMITGIRATAEIGVKAGFRHIQFTTVPDSLTLAVDAYLASLRPVDSPYLVDGELSSRAKEGEKVFKQQECDMCHSGAYFTDLSMHTMGIQGKYDHQNSWDTPTLIEVWRTAPYLHDGRAVTIYDMLKEHKHGLEGVDISDEDIDALSEYILSL